MIWSSAKGKRSLALGMVIVGILAGDAWKVAVHISNDPSPAVVSTYLPHLHAGERRRRGTFRVVALGDSVTAAVRCGCEGYVGDYSAWLADQTHRNVETLNFGLGGKTSYRLVDDVTNNPIVRKSLQRANVVLLMIGANDFDFSTYTGASCADLSCFGDDLSNLKENLETISSVIRSLRKGRRTYVIVTGYWAVWTDGIVGRAHGDTYMRVNYELTQHVNKLASDMADASFFHYADVFKPFHGADGARDDTNLLVEDGDHPSAAGHAIIADAMIGTGVPNL